MNFYAECMAYQGPQVSDIVTRILLGRHCCLWCEIASDQLRTPLETRGYSQPRTLSTLKENYYQFTQNGGNIKNAKFYKNTIHEHMMDIPIDQVCIHAHKAFLHSRTTLASLLASTPHRPGDILSAVHPPGTSCSPIRPETGKGEDWQWCARWQDVPGVQQTPDDSCHPQRGERGTRSCCGGVGAAGNTDSSVCYNRDIS